MEHFASVIVTAWNGKDYITDCLDSLVTQSYPNYEIIVVDNASTDGTPEIVAQRYPIVRLIRNERNLGFAGGTNVGIRAAKGDALFLFNQDAVADSNWLANMMWGMAESPDIGIVGCKIYYVSEVRRIWHAGSALVGERRQPVLRGDGEIDRGQYDCISDVEAVAGAAMGIRRTLLDQIGLFDEDYFLYFEDTDLCLRARQAGYRVVYLPQATAHHHVAGSLEKGTLATLCAYHKSRLRFLLKHFEPRWFVGQFLPAESEWLHHSAGLNDHLALNEAYLWAVTGILYCSQPFQFARERFKAGDRAAVLIALYRLMNEVIRYLSVQVAVNAWTTEGETDNSQWRLREIPFVSSIPIFGPLIVFCRELWNNMATRWYVRKLLEQQMQINRQLTAGLEAQGQLICALMRQIVSLEDGLKVLQNENEMEEPILSSNDCQGASSLE